MASVLLYPIAYGLELFLASALSTQIAVSLAAVLVSTAAVIYCQQTVALWWTLNSETTQTRTRFIRPHAIVEVKEERYEKAADGPRDRGGGEPANEPDVAEKETSKKKEETIILVTTPITAAALVKRKLSDDSEGSTEGSTASEDSETRRRKSSTSRDGQPEQSWLNNQPAYMHRSHWVAKPAQPKNNPLFYKPSSLVRRASADNNGHHHQRAAEFAHDVDTARKRDDESQTGGEKGREKPLKPTLDRRSSFPSSLPSATFFIQPPKVQTSSSLVTTALTSSSTSSPVATPSCSPAPVQATSTADEHGAVSAEGKARHTLPSRKREQSVSSPPTHAFSPSAAEEPKRMPYDKSTPQPLPLPSVSVMAPATIHEESESAEKPGKRIRCDTSARPVLKVSLAPEVPASTFGPTVKRKEGACPPRAKPLSLPTICVEPDSDRSDSESHSQSENHTRAIISPPKTKKSSEQFFVFSVKPVGSAGETIIEREVSLPERPHGLTRGDSLGIPSVTKGEISYPGSQRKRPIRSLSEPVTITVEPPVICEAKEAKDQTISQAIIRPIPQRADSLGIPQTYIGEAAFPIIQPQKDTTTMAVAGTLPRKPPGARRKEGLEVPSVATSEVSFPPISPATLMGPPLERPIKRNRPASLNIPSLSVGLTDLSPSTEMPMSAPVGGKRKHMSILKRANSQEKPAKKKSVSFSPTVSPHQLPPGDSFDRESDNGSHDGPKRPKIYRHYSMDSPDTSMRQERYRSLGRQFANAEEAGFLFSEDTPNMAGINRTCSDQYKFSDSEMLSPAASSLDGIDDIKTDPITPETDENDEVFIQEATFEVSNAKARFLAAGGPRAVMSVLCTQDSSDSSSQGTKFPSVDLIESVEKAVEPHETPATESKVPSETEPKPVKESTVTIMPVEETAIRMTTLSSADKDKAAGRTKRFFSNEDLNLRASLLFVETVRSSVESELSDGRQSHSSDESENSASEDTNGASQEEASNSAKSRFMQSCQINDPAPRHHRFHSDDSWNTPTIPELPEPLEIESPDEESTSAARDADIEESTSTSSSPSYSSSWYGFLEPDPTRPKLANLGLEAIGSTDNDLSAPIRSEDDTGDEIDDDDGGKVCVAGEKMAPKAVASTGDDVDTGDECSGVTKDSSPESTPIVEEEMVVAVAAPVVEAQLCSGSSMDDCLRHERPRMTSQAVASPRRSRRRHYKTPVILDNGSEVLKAGLADGSLPSVSMSAAVGRLRKDIESLKHRADVYMGNSLAKKLERVCVDHPMADGLVDDWADLERMWDHVISKELQIKWEDHPILLTEIASAPPRQREKILEMLFETFKVPACYIVNQGALALHANGETSGIVLSSGSGVTEVIPIYQGSTLTSAVTSLQTAGRGVTRRLQRLLMDQRAFTTSSASDHKIVREIKEKMAYVCEDYDNEVLAMDGQAPNQYVLPDGKSVSLRKTDLFKCTEMIFRPSLVGLTHQKGVMQIIEESIEKCDTTFLESVDPTILLVGGNTKLSGFSERLQSELNEGGLKQTVISHDNRDVMTWIGGAILASHSSFAEQWVGCEDYDEIGASLAHRQTLCP